jgi:hypothetical protein
MLELNVLDTNSLSSFVFSIFVFTRRIWRIFKIEKKKNTQKGLIFWTFLLVKYGKIFIMHFNGKNYIYSILNLEKKSLYLPPPLKTNLQTSFLLESLLSLGLNLSLMV